MDPIDSFQDHLTSFYHSVPKWLLSRPFDIILSLCTQSSPFKTIWPDFCIVYPTDSFHDHLTQFYHWVLIWLHSRPYDLFFVLCTQLIHFKTICPSFIIVYPIDFLKGAIGYTLQKPGHMVWKRVNWVHNDKIRSNGLESSQLGSEW